MVLPGQGKNFEAFQVDDAICRQFAAQQTGTTTERASGQRAAGAAAIGTVLGAGLGAAVGAAAGDPGSGSPSERGPACLAGLRWASAGPTPRSPPYRAVTTPPICSACMRRATRSPWPGAWCRRIRRSLCRPRSRHLRPSLARSPRPRRERRLRHRPFPEHCGPRPPADSPRFISMRTPDKPVQI